MRVLIVEDEPMAAAHLSDSLLQVLPNAEILASIDTMSEASAFLAVEQVDLVFMDIHLGDGLSFEIFDQVDVNAPIIFTTAYDQYALKAFEVHSIAYLLKPIGIEELERAIDKLNTIKLMAMSDLKGLVQALKPQKQLRERFLVTEGQRLKSIPVSDISWFLSDGRYTRIKTSRGQFYLIDDTLEKLSASLDDDQYFRVNRQVIVRFDAIVGMIPWSKSRIKLELSPACDVEVIVSVERSGPFKRWLNR